MFYSGETLSDDCSVIDPACCCDLVAASVFLLCFVPLCFTFVFVSRVFVVLFVNRLLPFLVNMFLWGLSSSQDEGTLHLTCTQLGVVPSTDAL